jgi:hypothetical protein
MRRGDGLVLCGTTVRRKGVRKPLLETPFDAWTAATPPWRRRAG